MTENVTISKEEYDNLKRMKELVSYLEQCLYRKKRELSWLKKNKLEKNKLVGYNNPNVVILTKEEYEEMEKQIRLLEHLQELGVDNWGWYSTPIDDEDDDMY